MFSKCNICCWGLVYERGADMKQIFNLTIHKNKKFALDFNNKTLWMKSPGQVMKVLRALIYNK